MEEKKPFMPPPPKELKNNPSKTKIVSKIEPKAEILPQNDAELFSKAEKVNSESLQQEDLRIQKKARVEMIEALPQEDKTVNKNEKMKTVLYWIGFAMCLSVIVLLIVFLIK